MIIKFRKIYLNMIETALVFSILFVKSKINHEYQYLDIKNYKKVVILQLPTYLQTQTRENSESNL